MKKVCSIFSGASLSSQTIISTPSLSAKLISTSSLRNRTLWESLLSQKKSSLGSVLSALLDSPIILGVIKHLDASVPLSTPHSLKPGVLESHDLYPALRAYFGSNPFISELLNPNKDEASSSSSSSSSSLLDKGVYAFDVCLASLLIPSLNPRTLVSVSFSGLFSLKSKGVFSGEEQVLDQPVFGLAYYHDALANTAHYFLGSFLKDHSLYFHYEALKSDQDFDSVNSAMIGCATLNKTPYSVSLVNQDSEMSTVSPIFDFFCEVDADAVKDRRHTFQRTKTLWTADIPDFEREAPVQENLALYSRLFYENCTRVYPNDFCLLYLFGSPGIGKTHCAGTIIQRLKQHGFFVWKSYYGSQPLSQDLYEACLRLSPKEANARIIETFSNDWRSVGVFLLEDLNLPDSNFGFFSRAVVEFAQKNRRKVLITSNQAPQDILKLGGPPLSTQQVRYYEVNGADYRERQAWYKGLDKMGVSGLSPESLPSWLSKLKSIKTQPAGLVLRGNCEPLKALLYESLPEGSVYTVDITQLDFEYLLRRKFDYVCVFVTDSCDSAQFLNQMETFFAQDGFKNHLGNSIHFIFMISDLTFNLNPFSSCKDDRSRLSDRVDSRIRCYYPTLTFSFL